MFLRTPFLCLAAFGFLGAGPAAAQSDSAAAPPPPPCSSPEARQFDFWVGDWNATWEGGKGTNSIRPILGGCVIEENFKDSSEGGLIGQSYSVYHPGSGMWKQTWVDNQGGYLDFTGGWNEAEGTMTLSRSATRNDQTFLQRMVFKNITEQKFDWSWERSDDEGATWKPLWEIRYVRSGS